MRAEPDRGLLSMVMIVVIVGIGLGALMVPMIVTQSQSTLHTDTRVQALHAAEAGIDAMLGRIRAATTDSGVTGIAKSLPCYSPALPAIAPLPASVASPLTAIVAGSPTTSYSVTLQYFTSDPLKALSSTNLLPIPMVCAPLSGPFEVGTGVVVPSFARISSVGTDSAGGSVSTRNVITTYTFNTTNAHINGGQIRLNPLSTGDVPLCMDAGLNPLIGNPITMRPCTSPATQAQLLFYNFDLSVQLLYSTSAAAPYGLCLDSAVSRANGNAVTLQACMSPGNAPYNQQWSLNGSASFLGTKADLSHDGFCLAVPNPGTATGGAQLPVPSGALLQVSTCPSGYTTTASWLPTPTVGAGAAGAGGGQLVNFSQFGRCADVTNQVAPTQAGAPFMILYPCKQDPRRPPQVDWNQKFAYSTTTQHWVTTTNATDYCLTSAGVAGAYVTVIACSTTNLLQNWTEFGVTVADQGNVTQWTYDKRYTVVDSRGLCLSLSPINGIGADWFVPPGTNLQYSKLTSDGCDGSTRQKWNADPDTKSSSVVNTTGN